MSQTLACPHCHGSVGVADDDLGFHVTCPHCERNFLAPGIKPAAELPASPSPHYGSDGPMESDEDDWLQLDEKPVSPNRDDEVLAQYMTKNHDSPQSGNRVDEFIVTTERVPSTGSQSPPTPTPTPSASSPQTPSADTTESGFDDLELPDFVDALPPARTQQPTDTALPAGAKPPTESAPKKRPESKSKVVQEYRIKCKTCGTPTYVKASQAGRKIKCVDCHSTITVPPPPKIRKTPAPMPEPKAMPLQENPKSNRRPDPFQKSADQLLAAAEAAEVESPPTNYDNPDVAEWFQSVFGIFTDSGVLVHWLVFSMIAALPTYIAIRSEQTILIGSLFPYAIIVGALIAACGFAILESVANQEDSVSSWPIFDPFAWLGHLFLAAAASAVPLVPIAAVFGTILGPTLLLVLLGMLGLYVLFPFVLLSMIDMDSPFAPFSPEVARSVTRCQDAWGGLYFSSGILFFALFLVIALMWTTVGVSGLFVSITAAVGVVFIYFAMIGRLAYAIGQGDS